MIKIQFNLDILLILRNRFTSELELLNQVLVRDLSETTLISVEIDIVDEQSSPCYPRRRTGRSRTP
jgi:hypothetical protein